MANASQSMADQAIIDMQVNTKKLDEALQRNPILVTALNPVLGYEKGAALAKRAYSEGRTLLDVALEDTDLGEAALRRLLDPTALAQGGIQPGMNGMGG